jgi:hypothetical protein
MIAGQFGGLIDYYVEAIDANGNSTLSDIQHVFVVPEPGVLALLAAIVLITPRSHKSLIANRQSLLTP